MKVVVINAGSSSLKYQLIDMDTSVVLAKGVCERIGIEGSSITHKRPGKEKYFVESFAGGSGGRDLSDLVPLSYGNEACAPGHAASGLRDYYMIHYVVSGRGRFEYR